MTTPYQTDLAAKTFQSEIEMKKAYEVMVKDWDQAIPQRVAHAFHETAQQVSRSFGLKAALVVGGALALGYVVLPLAGVVAAGGAVIAGVGGGGVLVSVQIAGYHRPRPTQP